MLHFAGGPATSGGKRLHIASARTALCGALIIMREDLGRLEPALHQFAVMTLTEE